MKVKNIHLKNFKRFADLSIVDIQPTVKLVVLLGPNGCGKSSLFDAMHMKSYEHAQMGIPFEPDYHHYKPATTRHQNPVIEFHDVSGLFPEAIYVRTAYRNDPVVQVDHISVGGPVLQERRFSQMIENDASTSQNYSRLVSNALERAFRKEDREKSLGKYQDETLGEIQDAMRRLFPDLVLNSLGNPLNDKTFTFDKGGSAGFPYKNLSGGEKSAFDLLLDVFVKREQFNNTVFCIDEPEAHMNPRLQAKLLEEIFRLINDNSQLWIATHAIGMMRKAWDLYEKNPGAVAFLDFGQRNFDARQVIKPTTPSREFWEQTHMIALDDLGALVVPGQIIICEGDEVDGFDADCYNKIFSAEFPDAKFISAGGKRGLKNYVQVIKAVAKGAEVFALRDHDNATDDEVERVAKEGIKVLRRNAIENYLLDDGVLRALCHKFWSGDQAKLDELIKLRETYSGQAKAVAHEILQRASAWGAPNIGSDWKSFLRDTLAPLIQPGMPVYEQLKTIIFGSDHAPTP